MKRIIIISILLFATLFVFLSNSCAYSKTLISSVILLPQLTNSDIDTEDEIIQETAKIQVNSTNETEELSHYLEDTRFSHFFKKRKDNKQNDGLISAYTLETIIPFIDIEFTTKGGETVYESATKCFINGVFIKNNKKIASFMIDSDSETYYYDLDVFINREYDFETFFDRGYGPNDLIIAMTDKRATTYDRWINDINNIGSFYKDPCFIVSIYPNQDEKEWYAQVIYKLDEEYRGGYKLSWIYLNEVTEIDYDDNYKDLYPIKAYAKSAEEIDLREDLALNSPKKIEHNISDNTELNVLSIYITNKDKIAYVTYKYNLNTVYAYCKLSHLFLPQ